MFFQTDHQFKDPCQTIMSRNASTVRIHATAHNETSLGDNMNNDSTNTVETELSQNQVESGLSNHHHKRRKKKDKNKLVPEINVWEDDISQNNDNKALEEEEQKYSNFDEMKYLTGGSELSMEMHPYSGDLEQKVNHFLASNWDKESLHDSKSDISVPKTFNVSLMLVLICTDL